MNRKHTATLIAALGLLALATTASAAGTRDRLDRANSLRSAAIPTPVVESVTGTDADADLSATLGRRSPTTPSNPVITPVVVPVATGEDQILRGLALSRVTWEQELTTAKPLFRRANFHVQKATLVSDVEDLDTGRIDGPAQRANYAIEQARPLNGDGRN